MGRLPLLALLVSAVACGQWQLSSTDGTQKSDWATHAGRAAGLDRRVSMPDLSNTDTAASLAGMRRSFPQLQSPRAFFPGQQHEHLRNAMTSMGELGVTRTFNASDWDLLWSYTYPFNRASPEFYNLMKQAHRRVASATAAEDSATNGWVYNPLLHHFGAQLS